MLLFQITHCQEIDICDNLRFLRHLRSMILLGQPQKQHQMQEHLFYSDGGQRI